MRLRLSILFAVCCLLAADAPRKEPAKVEKKLWAAISVNRPVWVPGRRTEPLMLYFGLVNDGDKVVDPEITSTQLLVNGKELENWAMTVGSGPRESGGLRCPPGMAFKPVLPSASASKRLAFTRCHGKAKGFNLQKSSSGSCPRRSRSRA